MYLPSLAVQANAVRKVIFQKPVARRPPQFGTSVRGMGEVIALNQVIRRTNQMERIPHLIGFVFADNTVTYLLKHQTSPRRQLSPPMTRIVIVMRKITLLDQ